MHSPSCSKPSLSCSGTLIRRHRVPRPAPSDDTYYTVEDFNVGKQITLYGRIFSIVVHQLIVLALCEMRKYVLTFLPSLPPQDCDGFTRNFLQKLGVRVPPPQDTPTDPYTQHRSEVGHSWSSPESRV